MKLNIVYRTYPNMPQDGYNYIEPVKLGDVENESCTEIKLNNTLDFIQERDRVLQECMSKMRKNCTLSLSGLDLGILCKNVVYGDITVGECNNILYQHGNKSIDNLFKLIAFFTQNGFKIVEKKLAGFTYFIKVQK